MAHTYVCHACDAHRESAIPCVVPDAAEAPFQCIYSLAPNAEDWQIDDKVRIINSRYSRVAIYSADNVTPVVRP